MKLRRDIFALCLSTLVWAMSPTHGSAHEFWISLDEGKVNPGSVIEADLKVGQMLRGDPYPYLSNYFQSFNLSLGEKSQPVDGFEGDIPALRHRNAKQGLNIFTHQTVPFRVTYDEWGIFRTYLKDEGLNAFAELHVARGLPENGFSERYTRYAKALVQVGPTRTEDLDQHQGMLFELVATNNPYDPIATDLEVQLFWKGEPVSNHQVNVFHNDAHEGKTPTRTVISTDKNGLVRIPLGARGEYLLNAVFLEPVENAPVVWSSHWATLSFKL